MSRMLAELLGVPGAGFRLNLQQLERASGAPGVDIRLSTEVLQETQSKIRGVGLDPADTTAPELYEILKTKIIGDNTRLEKTLQQRIGNGQISQAIVKTINALQIPKSCFALKHSVAKRMLKKNPPKASLKRLGYRSLDSLLKREPAAVIFTVADLVESDAWRQRFFDDYKRLGPSDFEVREIEVFNPLKAKHWTTLAQSLAAQQKSSVLVCKELGGIVLLPLPEGINAGTITTVVMTLQAINEIRTHSAFCKLQQVKQNFGAIIADSTKGDVSNLTLIAGQPLPWRVIQNYYSRFDNDYPMELFEPHVQQDDLKLINIEDVLANIEPALEFWRGTDWLAFNENSEVVSLNIKDVAISALNNLGFEDRLLKYFRDTAWSELMIRYLQQKHLEENVRQQLDAQLVDDNPEPTFEMNFAGA